MTTLDMVVSFTLAVVLIVGAYQFYFWCQRRTRQRTRTFKFALDNRIPLRPAWVWVYSGLYYPAFGVVVSTTRNARDFNYMAFSYLLLLTAHSVIFVAFPVAVPSTWRQYDRLGSVSERFLALVHKFDDRSNCFPSMHVSVATLTGLHAMRNTGCGPAVPLIFVASIALSCIFTKQHYLIDVPLAVILGTGAFRLFSYLLMLQT